MDSEYLGACPVGALRRHGLLIGMLVGLLLIAIVLIGGQTGAVADQPQAEVSLQASQGLIAAGDTFTVTVHLQTWVNYFGFYYQIEFDPTVLEVVDADTETAGVQIHPGDVFAGRQTWPAANTVNNSTGVIKHGETLVTGDPAYSPGSLAYIVFRAKAQGTSALHFMNDSITPDSLSDQNGYSIATRWVDGSITVVEPLRLYLPLIVDNS